MEEQHRQKKKLFSYDGEPRWGSITIAMVLSFLLLIGLIMAIVPPYNLWAAQYQKKIQVEDAEGKRLAATKLKETEIIRAEGIAEANRIIAGSISPEYIRYRFIEGLNDGNTEVIYVPTEANLPILEARDERLK